METPDVLIAYDSLGSTADDAMYHKKSRQIVDDIFERYQGVRILSWNHEGEYITKGLFDNLNRMNHGDGGTDIDCIARALIDDNFHGKLVIITDGGVNPYSVHKCNDVMQLFTGRITDVDVHVITWGEADLSVTCPFTRRCPHKVYMHTHMSGTTELSVSSDDIALIDQIDAIDTLEEFEEKHDAILRALTARFMGSVVTDPELHDQLVRCQNRVIADVQSKNARGDLIAILGEAIDNPDRFDECLGIFRDMLRGETGAPAGILRRFAELLNITRGGCARRFRTACVAPTSWTSPR
jgi:hypothetical protein